MPKHLPILLLYALSVTGCAATEKIPVAVSCPPPPPVPAILQQPASTGPSLSQQYERLRQELSDSLTRAMKPE